jgi:hypothetical protein
MRGLCDEYNGFWIGWLDLFELLYNYNQLWQFTIHGCLSLAPFLTGLRVSSLPLWPTWFWFTNWSLLLMRLPWTTTVLWMNRSSLLGSLYSLARILEKCLLIPLTWKAHSVLSWFPWIHISIKPVLASRCLEMDYSGFQAACHNIDIVLIPAKESS